MKDFRFITLLGALLFSFLLSAEATPAKIDISSPSFKHNAPIPEKFTCDGKDISPALEWKNVPPNTKSIVIIADDPDAPVGIWVHWVLFNISPDIKKIDENADMKNIAVQGMTDFKDKKYGGPCPPSGTHRYFFKIYALDTMLSIKEGATKKDVEKAMKDHIIGSGEIIGKYKRR